MNDLLTPSFPMHPFSTPENNRKPFQGIEKEGIGNEWVTLQE